MFSKNCKKSFLVVFALLIIAGGSLVSADVSLAESVRRITINTNLPVPTLEIEHQNQAGQVSGEVTISGEAINFGKVDIYLDGSFKGNVPVTNEGDGYGSWEYTFDEELAPGDHRIFVNLSYFQKNKSLSVEKEFEYVRDLVSTPTIFEPAMIGGSPLVRGVMFSGHDIEIHIDGQLDGVSKVTDHHSGVGSFQYRPSFSLENGYHFIKARAIRKSDGKKSPFTDILIFQLGNLEKASFLQTKKGEFVPPVPAPTILSPQSGTVFVQGQGQIKVQGVVHDNHRIKIYFDDLFAGSFVPESEGGTEVIPFDFSLEQNPDITRGVHTIRLQAVNPQDQVSGLSDELAIFIVKGDEKRVYPAPSQIGGGVSSQVLGDADEQEIPEEVLDPAEDSDSTEEVTVGEDQSAEEGTGSANSEKLIKFGVFFFVLIMVGFFIGYVFRKDEE